MESKKLIFDIGFHKGEDTSYYLHSRYSVVGVDADPSMIQEAKTVFKKELDSGQLTLLNFAVSDSDDAIVGTEYQRLVLLEFSEEEHREQGK